MLGSKQHVFYWNVFDLFNYNLPASALLKKSRSKLIYLFAPEDTTAATGLRDSISQRLEVSNLWNVIKAVFWMAISISISIGIGQFG